MARGWVAGDVLWEEAKDAREVGGAEWEDAWAAFEVAAIKVGLLRPCPPIIIRPHTAKARIKESNCSSSRLRIWANKCWRFGNESASWKKRDKT